jgi:CheY-like chemotaxis protein
VVLVVDNHPPTRELTARTAERLGYLATQVENGRMALTWLENNQTPAAIMLDLVMLEADGFNFLRELRVRPGWRDIPVIVLIAKALSVTECAELETMTQGMVANRRGADRQSTRVAEGVLNPALG